MLHCKNKTNGAQINLCKYTYFVRNCWFYSHSETHDILKHYEISNSHRGVNF